jgi:hypothetical protein
MEQRLSSRCRPRSLTNSSWRSHSPTIGGVAKWSGDATRSWASSLPNVSYVGLRARGRACWERSRNDRSGGKTRLLRYGCASAFASPCGSTGTSRARRCASREGAPRHARVPPIGYWDGLSLCLTSHQENNFTTIIQRRRQHPRHTGRDRSKQVVAIRRNRWSRSSVCPCRGCVRIYIHRPALHRLHLPSRP